MGGIFFISAGSARAQFTVQFEPPVIGCAYQDGPARTYFGTPDIHGGFAGTACTTYFYQGRGIAYRFHLDTAYHINSLQGSMYQVNDDPFEQEVGTHDLVIYGGNAFFPQQGFIPQVPNKLFDQPFTVREEGFNDLVNDFHWQGVNNINLKLQKGDYWLAFENVRSPTTSATVIGPGVRIGAFAVPEPNTMFLLGAGLLGFLLRLRKQGVWKTI